LTVFGRIVKQLPSLGGFLFHSAIGDGIRYYQVNVSLIEMRELTPQSKILLQPWAKISVRLKLNQKIDVTVRGIELICSG